MVKGGSPWDSQGLNYTNKFFTQIDYLTRSETPDTINFRVVEIVSFISLIVILILIKKVLKKK